MPTCWFLQQQAIRNDVRYVSQVNHRGPWVFTVAASTKDQVLFDGVLSASGPGNPPPDTQNIGLSIGSASPDGTPLTDFPIRHFTGQDPDYRRLQ